jgi:hypothetical protein
LIFFENVKKLNFFGKIKNFSSKNLKSNKHLKFILEYYSAGYGLQQVTAGSRLSVLIVENVHLLTP